MTPRTNAALAGIVLVGAIAALAIPEAAPLAIEGYATVIDGDTLIVHNRPGWGEKGTRVRLAQIDAPERDQFCTSAQGNAWACGKASRNALERMLASGAQIPRHLLPALHGQI